jgi:NAD(P)-dependent dehydrogenase (short-subunit alcohol dehydrogenase family)
MIATQKLSGTVALVTGGSRSIGVGIAKQLAAGGAADEIASFVAKRASSPARACSWMEGTRPEIGNFTSKPTNKISKEPKS